MMARTSLLSVFLLVTVWGPAFAEDPGQQLEGFNLQGYTESGEKNWDVKGDRADIQGNMIKITNVDANQYGPYEVNLKAKDGVVQKDTGNVHLEQDVVVTAKSGEQLKTDSLDWEKEKDRVSTADPVELKDEARGVTISGTGLEASPGLKTAAMQKDVTVAIQPEADQGLGAPVTITCDGPMEIDQKKNVAVLKNNVVAVQNDRTLKADRMEITFDATAKKVSQMICDGNVFLVQGGNSTQAQHAVYDAVSQRITLSGRPKIVLITEGPGSIAELSQKEKAARPDSAEDLSDRK